MKKSNLYQVLFVLIIILISCANKDKNPEVEVKKDYYDSIRKLTVHVITADDLEKTSDSVKSYYEKFGNYEIWIDRENREDLIAQIEKSKLEGLNPDDYNLKKIYSKEVLHDSLSKSDVIAYDIMLTETFEKLATHYYKGKIAPQTVYKTWDLFEKRTAIKSWLFSSIKEKKVASVLKGLLPKHLTYQQLKSALKEINKYQDTRFDSLRFLKKATLNDTLPNLASIRKKLLFWGDLKKEIIGKIYDTITFNAVKKFQHRHGLLADGVIGAGTIKALNYNQHTRKDQILANLERWRWYPSDFGEKHILVNLPEYYLSYVVKNDTIDTRKVVVGRPKRPTPVLSSKLSNIVYNPTWTVPPTIIKEDLAVDAKRNRNYFSASRITIFDANNNEVSPYRWNPDKPNNYRYVQKPGYNNSLGLVKFNFPNSHLVYLHDTNHREMFAYNYRALSSGCVRVENPIPFSRLILKDQDNERWDEKEVDKIIKKSETYAIKLKEPIFIHQLYWTAWYKNGLKFRDDIYNLDLKLASELLNTH